MEKKTIAEIEMERDLTQDQKKLRERDVGENSIISLLLVFQMFFDLLLNTMSRIFSLFITI